MAIITTAIGSNSYRIDYTETDTFLNILNALHTKITDSG